MENENQSGNAAETVQAEVVTPEVVGRRVIDPVKQDRVAKAFEGLVESLKAEGVEVGYIGVEAIGTAARLAIGDGVTRLNFVNMSDDAFVGTKDPTLIPFLKLKNLVGRELATLIAFGGRPGRSESREEAPPVDVEFTDSAPDSEKRNG